jgi:DNA invertase Pin-like site-specific DNA recombinase
LTAGKLPNPGILPALKPKGRPGQDQNLSLQLDDLKKAGCRKIFQEKVSSAKVRPQLQKLLEVLREGDTIMVWKLDRLGRSLKELFTLINDFQAKSIGFRSLNDAAPRWLLIPLRLKDA